MNNFLILVAGGQGLRMGSEVPKQFMLLGGRPVIMRTIDRFMEALPDLHVVVVLNPDYVDMWQRLCDEHHFQVPCKVALGGRERFFSVRNGLEEIKDADASSLVGVHDAVRPLVSVEVIRRTYSAAAEQEAVVPALPSVESVRIVGDAGSSEAIDRRRVMMVQTPQVFSLSLLRRAYGQPYSETFTDDASVVEALGQTVHIVPGNRENIKLTTPLDMQMAEMLLNLFAKPNEQNDACITSAMARKGGCEETKG